MKLGFLGQVIEETGAGPMLTTVRRPPLPSSEAIAAALRGDPGGWAKVAASTALRAVLIAPGFYVAGARGWRMALGAMVSSVSITTFIFLFYRASETPDAS